MSVARRVRMLAVLIPLALTGTVARAALIAADDFEGYGPGSIQGNAGGAGWSGAWQGAGASVENVIDTSGAELVYRTASGEAVRGSDRALAFTGNDDFAAVRDLDGLERPRDVYVSMLVRFTGTQNINDFLALWFEEAGFGAAPNIGVKMEDGSGATVEDFFVRTRANNHVTVQDIVNGETYFIVGHMSKPNNGRPFEYDEFRLWVNPVTLASEPAEDAVSSGDSNVNEFARIGFRAVNLDADDQVVIDRLRIGTTWEDVTEPDIVPVLELRMDEQRWTGAPGEVVDVWSGLDGTAFNGVDTSNVDPAVPGAVGTCRYGDFDGSNDHVQVPHDPALNGTDALTYMAWIRPDGWSGIRQVMAKSVHGGGSGRAQMGLFSESGRFKVRAETDRGRLEADTALPAVGTWTHVAGVFSGRRLELYVNGSLAAVETFPPARLNQTTDPLVISKRYPDARYHFDGGLDEVRVYTAVLDATAIRAAMDATRPCAAPPIAAASALRIDHDGAGIHCLEEAVSVSALDAVGAVYPDYAGQISLVTDSGRGTWSLLAGSGAFNDAAADDGAATYTFAAADGGTATFSLSYPEGASPVNVDAVEVADPGVRDDDSEGPLTFAPSGFTVTASALPNPPPSPIADPLPTQAAGVDFPLHITAYGVTEDDPQCGVIESYAGPRDVSFTMTYDNPGSGTLLADVAGGAANGAVRQVTFTAGQTSVTARYDDAGRIRLALQDAASFGHTLNGASNAFVVQPYELRVVGVRSTGGAANPGATSMTGTPFVPAGEVFEVDVEAVDADGDRTPNFGRESPAESVRVRSEPPIVAPAGGRNGSTGDVANGAAFAATAVPGRFRNDRVAFDEVGIIRLRPAVADGDYLGSGAVPGLLSGAVGRFFPASFDVIGDVVSAACGGFTYMDQPALSLEFVLQALNATGGVTENYDASLLAPAAMADYALGAEAADDGNDLGGRLTVPGAVWSAGEVVVNRNDVTLARAAGPDGPFDPLQLSLMVVDPLGDTGLAGLDSNPAASGDCVAAGNCSARTVGAPTRVVYGRLAVLPAAGPENENLRIPLAAQLFTGSAFESHGADGCTGYAAADVSLGAYAGDLAAGETAVIGPAGSPTLVAGAADPADPVVLAAPGFGNAGSVEVTLDVPGWLEFDWQGTGLEDPTGTAEFGRFRGHDRIIYWGEPR